jgi:hypothetical protein
MKPVRLILVFLSVSSALHAADSLSASTLLDRVIMEPGGYNQNCAGLPFLAWEAPVRIRLYAANFQDGATHFLSNRDLQELGQQRDAVVKEVAKRLSRIEPLFPVSHRDVAGRAKAPVGVYFGRDEDALGPILFDVIANLNAVEAFPALLRIERELDQALLVGEPPLIRLSQSIETRKLMEQFTLDSRPSTDRETPATRDAKFENIAAARVRVEILSLCLRLLRAQRFPPLLQSQIETAYHDALVKSLSRSEYQAYRTRADAKAAGRPWVLFDPIYNIPVVQMKVEVPFTPELRAQIVALTERFLKEVPQEKWLRDSLPR